MTSAASLVFAPGRRPSSDRVRILSERGGGFAIGHDPRESPPGDVVAMPQNPVWLELLASGLSFDLSGLAPGPPASSPPQRGAGAIEANVPPGGEAVLLCPGPHLREGATMRPVLRRLAWLAAELAILPDVRAVAWHPARCWSEPDAFRTAVLHWIDGGPFPAPVLAALTPQPDGALLSEGLAAFVGQELRIEPQLAADRADAARLALRVMDWLVAHGPLTEAEDLAAPDGRPLRLSPSPNRRFARLWKGGG